MVSNNNRIIKETVWCSKHFNQNNNTGNSNRSIIQIKSNKGHGNTADKD